jgi:hypothetical protein
MRLVGKIKAKRQKLVRALMISEPQMPCGWSGRRESNPHEKLGKLSGYHYITPALPKP